jgi:UDP-N-acetylglucosamine--N-acetylmuramyl-(pentapeptide) pyrophosphoryl-undecaprenol N-acetylglucosamine transferase
VVLCEQNARPGLANRLLARLAERIYTGFEHTESLDRRKVLWTGNPLRAEIARAAADRAAWPPPAGCPERFTVFVIGGSQGARAINRAVVDALPQLSGAERLFFVHQTGSADEPWVREAYREAGVAGRVQAFFDDMAELYRQADLIVCRAGASTVAEVTALGKAALFIPFPHAADDHQRLNARRLAEREAAEWLDEAELDGARLAASIRRHVDDPRALRAMAERAWALGRPDAARRIVDDLGRIAARRRPPQPAGAGAAAPGEPHGGGRDVP